MIFKILIKPILFVFLISGFVVGSNISAQAQDFQKEIDELEFVLNEASKSMEEYVDQVDFSSFEAKFLQKKLGQSPQVFPKWIRDNIIWTPYIGALKGANGTLMAGNGNLLDQTILLERLLHFSGYQTKIQSIDTNKTLRKLMNEQFNKRNSNLDKNTQVHPDQDDTLLRLSKDNVFHSHAVDRKKLLQQLTQKTKQHFQSIGKVIDNVKSAVEVVDSKENAFANYYWVSYSKDGNSWSTLSVVNGVDNSQFLSSEAVTFEYTTLPQNIRHSVFFTLSIQVKDEGVEDKRTVELFKKTIEMYRSRVHSASVSFIGNRDAIIQENVSKADTKKTNPIELLTASNAWVPVIKFESAEIAQLGFDINGKTYSSNEMDKMSEVVTGSVENAVDLLGGLGGNNATKKKKSELVGVVLNWKIVRPGAEAEVFSRNLLLNNGIVGNDLWQRNVSILLHGKYNFMLQNAKISDTYLNYRVAQNFNNANYSLKYMLGKMRDNSFKFLENISKVLSRRNDSSAVDLLEFANVRLKHDPYSYLHKANLASERDFLYISESESEKMVQGRLFDIISNESESINSNAREMKMKSGIWDTELEHRQFAYSNLASTNTAKHYSSYSAGDYLLIKSEAALQNVELVDTERDIMRSELANGHWLILAKVVENSRSDMGELVWWRYTPRSACIVGQVATEFGVAGGFTEHVVELYTKILPWQTFLYDIGSCFVAGATSSTSGAARGISFAACFVCAAIKQGISRAGAKNLKVVSEQALKTAKLNQGAGELFRKGGCSFLGWLVGTVK